jgi:chromosome segregation ATPase
VNQSPPEPPKPPALPPTAAGGPPPRPEEVDILFVPSAADITAEDQAFIERVFDAVKDVEFNLPPPPPPKNLTGVDAKLQSLRDTVRKLERELARVGHIWRIKQKRVAEVDSIIKNAQTARTHAESRLATVKQEAAKSKADAERLEKQLAEKSTESQGRADTIAALEREKAALVADTKSKLEQVQTVFNDLRDKSSKAVSGLEAQLKKVEDELKTARDSLGSMGKRLGEREQTIKVLTDEMTQARADFTERLEATKRELAAKTEEAERLSREFDAARQSAAAAPASSGQAG